MTRIFRYAALALVVLSAGPLVRMTFDSAVQAQDPRARDWRAASAPAGWAPAPDDHPDAVVQAYCAPVVRWRGAFGDHCWVAA
ncbi:MAG: DUF3750 domain-containing protein, partial [Rhodospirillaceae bacterium]|nr:DUF3750 domain-containing protein [Rhodospirillaceae bacterium]